MHVVENFLFCFSLSPSYVVGISLSFKLFFGHKLVLELPPLHWFTTCECNLLETSSNALTYSLRMLARSFLTFTILHHIIVVEFLISEMFKTCKVIDQISSFDCIITCTTY